ncbi:MAG: ABC transporter ATP-binding protein [Herpetosiphon sp.]
MIGSSAGDWIAMASANSYPAGAAKSLGGQLAYIPRTLRLIWRAAPALTTSWFVVLVLQGLLPAVIVFLFKLLVDSLGKAIGAGYTWSQLRPSLELVALNAAVILLAEVLQGVADWLRTAQGEYVQDCIMELVHRKSIAVDIAFYESPTYYDRLDQARSEASSRSQTLLESTGSFLQNGVTLLAMGAILIPYGAWLPIVLLFSTLPAFFVILKFDRQYHLWWQRTTTDRRLTQYFDVLMTHGQSAAEIRAFGLGLHFHSAYQTLRHRLRSARLHQLRRQSLGRIGVGSFALFIAGGSLGWMVWRALQGTQTMGDLVLFYQAFSRGQGLMRALLGNIGQLYTNSLFLGNLFEFLELQPQIVDPQHPTPIQLPLRQAIRFSHVTFRYPDTEAPALEDFSLSIPAGKIVAIVGANGAGKTTLIKLLCRFYDPEAGRIDIDGIDIRSVAIAELRRLMTVLFQFPLPFYHASASDNITLGDIMSHPDEASVAAAARSAGAHELISGLPHGYATLLGKWFPGGVELSGGEWQRIAMARAFLRQAPIILLDEPTSAMDSWAEADWFARLRSLATGRTTVIITHRFTIAMRADIIHVMDGGQIVESGSHAELVANGDRYAQSWAAQQQASMQSAPDCEHAPV